MADISNRMKFVLHVSHGAQGFQESYYLKTTSYTDGLVAGTKLLHYRRSLLAAGCAILWARVSFLGKPRERRGISGGPWGPLPQVPGQSTTDNPSDALHYALESGTGRWGNRLFRCVQDDMIQDYHFNGIMPEPLNPALLLSDPLDGAASLNRIISSFLRWLVENTDHVRITDKGPPTLGDTEAWAAIIPRKVANRKTGRAFGVSRGRAAS